MMINQAAINKLHEECKISEKGISSYWIELLSGFEFKDGQFYGRGLPEGEGGDGKTIIHRIAHYILQTPFRLQGKRFPEFKKILKTARNIHKRRNNKMQLGTLRQVIALACLEQYVKVSKLTDPIVIIGDGFGSLASLILSHFPNLEAKVVIINLTPNLLIDAVFINKSVPNLNIALVKSAVEYSNALEDKVIRAVLIQADNAELISHEKIGLVINIASMQEMNQEIIREYFAFIRTSKNSVTYFYCDNRVEKTLPDGTILNFFKYPWHPQDKIYIDELCPWHQYHYSFRPPFYFPYDGPHQHRLVLLNKS